MAATASPINAPTRPTEPKRTSFDAPNRGSSSRRGGTFAGIGTNETNRTSQDGGVRSPRAADGSAEAMSEEQLLKAEAEKQKRREKSMSQFSLTGACQV